MSKHYLDSDGLAYMWQKIKGYFAKKQDVIIGTAGQVVGFDTEGKPVAQDLPDNGAYAFSISGDGHLLCSYSGKEPPNYYINSSGHLCLDI